MTLWAKVTFQFERLHCWPEAPAEVSFLRNLHRHIFHATVWVEQFHDERDVEYILLKRHLERTVAATHLLDRASCESMAMTIYAIARSYAQLHANRRVRVEVTEDGENGAYLEE